ncbi:putative sporulation protein YtxC [Metabacillus herbersteinensis]|uniref:Sporulation protein YtxC n=1 Tax=Metabacillus herbersteinensis TaxID=283816 RepID=A0ABV6G9M9_9BACI
MLEILFESPREAETMVSIFRSKSKGNDSEIRLLYSNGVQICQKKWSNVIEQAVIPSLVHYILEYKEHQIMLSIIRENYYFIEHEEQQQILHIAQSIIEGERKEIPRVNQFQPREEFILEALRQFLTPPLSFTFQSFLQFRLQHYVKRLREYVEVAIEEYKLEQEYQTFIQSLRDYITDRESKIDTLTIHHQERFILYDEQLNEISELDIKNYIDRTFIYKHPMYIDSNLLAPIVSIAPKMIHLYSNDPDHGMIQTIQNIFQERVKIY